MEHLEAILTADTETNPEVLGTKIMDTSIDYLVSRAKAIRDNSLDWKLKKDDFEVTEDLSIQLRGEHEVGRPIIATYPMTPYSFSQMCAKFGMPMSYAKRLVKMGRQDLLVHNLNELLASQDEDKVYLIREHAGATRAFLSDKYAIVDSYNILTMAKELIPDSYHIISSHLSPERLHVRYLGEKLNIPGQDLYVGIQIDSSDVGRKNLTIDFFIYKQICSNGLKVAQLQSNLFRKVHLGGQLNELDFYREFKKGMLYIDEYVARMEEEITRAMHNDLTEIKFKKLYEKVQKSFGLKETEEEVTQYMMPYGKSLFAFINALTEIAQKYTLDRRMELEELAGSLLVA